MYFDISRLEVEYYVIIDKLINDINAKVGMLLDSIILEPFDTNNIRVNTDYYMGMYLSKIKNENMGIYSKLKNGV
jgi:hypothetical protein